MPNYNGYMNRNIIDQLLRQKENVENLLNEYSQPQAPVQNIINTGGAYEFEARILNDNEEIENIFVNKRTMFLDKKNKKLSIKELDGTISEEYEIVIPLDEKDKKIIELENKIKEMEGKYEYSKSTSANNEKPKSNGNDNEYNDTPTTTNGKSVLTEAE